MRKALFHLAEKLLSISFVFQQQLQAESPKKPAIPQSDIKNGICYEFTKNVQKSLELMWNKKERFSWENTPSVTKAGGLRVLHPSFVKTSEINGKPRQQQSTTPGSGLRLGILYFYIPALKQFSCLVSAQPHVFYRNSSI